MVLANLTLTFPNKAVQDFRISSKDLIKIDSGHCFYTSISKKNIRNRRNSTSFYNRKVKNSKKITLKKHNYEAR